MNILNFIKITPFLLSVIALLQISCNSTPEIALIDSNINAQKSYTFDYNNAFTNGFVIPSKGKDGAEFFQLTFQLTHFNTNEALYYKVFYQNESYKFLEEVDGKYNELASENFYGSWEDVTKTFNQIEINNKDLAPTFSTSFKITGNPRNENRYLGANRHGAVVSEEAIRKKVESIKSNKKWLLSIEEKAKKNNKTIEEQLTRDARWSLSSNTNNKWQRNPRVGKYSLLVVVTDQDGLNNIPDHIKNISISHEGEYLNPYYYFLHGNGKQLSGVHTYTIEDFISIKADVPLTNGIYVDYNKTRFESNEFFNDYVGNSKELYANAAFKYKHAFQSNTEYFMNVPDHADFLNRGYSRKEYEENIKASETERIKTFFTNTRYPGESFGVDQEKKAIWFKNPGNKNGEHRKENVGIKTRHGLTYGKYTYKIKMAELLTKDNIWTGITNAIWMINDGSAEWNYRRICNKEGFMPFYGAGKGETRVPQISYSEIDFEILKAAESWPRLSYKDQKERIDPDSHKNKVMIACTNWDMACKDPGNFDVGLRHIDYDNQIFNIHRWDEFYNALTSKVPASDDELFAGEYYYFQLEWKPTEIIWRVGPEKDKLSVVGYMNDQVTTIPNNQMVSVITQEYHFSKWWPNSPFKQEDIPFPAKDLNGMLYSLEIE